MVVSRMKLRTAAWALFIAMLIAEMPPAAARRSHVQFTISLASNCSQIDWRMPGGLPKFLESARQAALDDVRAVLLRSSSTAGLVSASQLPTMVQST